MYVYKSFYTQSNNELIKDLSSLTELIEKEKADIKQHVSSVFGPYSNISVFTCYMCIASHYCQRQVLFFKLRSSSFSFSNLNTNSRQLLYINSPTVVALLRF